MSEEKSGRIEIIDALRGLAVILMVAHHLLYDLTEFMGAPEWLFTNPVFDILHYVFAGLFILLSGVSSRFSRSNIKRGLKVIAVALLITAVTWYMDMVILFGILHFLGFCMVFYGLTRGLWDRINERAAPFIYLGALILSAVVVSLLDAAVNVKWLFFLGLTPDGFFSADYFPILPWVFVFLLGTWLGRLIKERRLPKWFYEFKVPFFPAVGRRALIIYILHQPVLYGACMGILALTKG